MGEWDTGSLQRSPCSTSNLFRSLSFYKRVRVYSFKDLQGLGNRARKRVLVQGAGLRASGQRASVRTLSVYGLRFWKKGVVFRVNVKALGSRAWFGFRFLRLFTGA